MRKSLSKLVLLGALTSFSFGGYISATNIKAILVEKNKWVLVNIEDQSNTCHHWGYNLKLDITTEQGKAMFKLLTIAKITDTTVGIGYTNSPTPGTDHNSGCSKDNMSEIYAVSSN